MIAAMTGDYSVYESWSPVRSRTSGLLVQNRQIYRVGDGGPAVGYEPDGRFIMGSPKARPAKLELPGIGVTVGALNPSPAALDGIRSDQVAVYTHTATQVTIPSGYVGVLLRSTALQNDLRGKSGFQNPAGADRPETVVAFRFTEPTATARTVSMPILKPPACTTGVCQPGAILGVPTGDTLALAKTSSPNPTAADGLERLAARGTPSVVTTIDSAGWNTVTDVTAGKPELVQDGASISARPSFVDPWQWDCGGGCWRPALVQSGGRGWLILIGAASARGLTMPQFAGVLQQLGATNAMGFDNNNSAELWRPGHAPLTGYGYQRLLPTATTLSYLG
jgi:Phosphodiester glycosidase